jgi:hypothetical protein
MNPGFSHLTVRTLVAWPPAARRRLRASVKHWLRPLIQVVVLTAACVSLLTVAGPAVAAPALAVGAKPVAVRVVCLAETEDSLLKDQKDRVALRLRRAQAGLADFTFDSKSSSARLQQFLKAEYPPVGRWHYLPIGTGFIVDAERMHVVTNWHVALSCLRDESAKIQIGILEGAGADIEPILAEVLDGRDVRDGRGLIARETVKLGVLCRNRDQDCSQSSPTNVEFFAPDLAVLRLQHRAQTAPIPIAAGLPIDARTELQLAGFPRVAMSLGQGNGSPRRQSVTMTMTPAKYSNPFSRDNVRPGRAQENIVSADFMMLAAQVHLGNSGGPVLAGDQVVGVVTASVLPANAGRASDSSGIDSGLAVAGGDAVIPAGFALAVKASEVIKTLEWFYIKPVGIVPPAPAPTPEPVITPAPEPSTASAVWWLNRQNQVFLALATCLLIATVAFFMVKPREVPLRSAAGHDGLAGARTAATQGVVPDAPKRPAAESAPPVAHPAQVELRATHGPLNGQMFPLPTPNGGVALIVGRNPQTCQVVFPNETNVVSRLHCSFIWNASNQTLAVEDLGSSEGTFVNGKRLIKNEKAFLNTGDTVDLGGVTMNRFSVYRN